MSFSLALSHRSPCLCAAARVWTQCYKAAILWMEKLERKKAATQAARGKRKDRDDHSKEGGQEAGEVAKALKEVLELAAPYYSYDFKDRFFKIELDATTGQPTEATVEALKEKINSE